MDHPLAHTAHLIDQGLYVEAAPIAEPDAPPRSYYRTREWHELAAACRLRDNATCTECGAPGRDVHHVVPRRQGGADALDNLTTLCASCHSAHHPTLPQVVFLNR